MVIFGDLAKGQNLMTKQEIQVSRLLRDFPFAPTNVANLEE